MWAAQAMMLWCGITMFGILLTSMIFLYAWQYTIVAVVGFTIFGIAISAALFTGLSAGYLMYGKSFFVGRSDDCNSQDGPIW